MGRFAKRFSGERPVSLGFELTFLSEYSEFVWRVLDRDAKRRACISQAPAKVPFENFSFNIFFLLYILPLTFAIKNAKIVLIR